MYAAYVNGIKEPRGNTFGWSNVTTFKRLYKKLKMKKEMGKNVKYTKVETENGTVKEKLYEEERIVLEALSSGQDGIFSDSRNLYKSGSKVT